MENVSHFVCCVEQVEIIHVSCNMYNTKGEKWSNLSTMIVFLRSSLHFVT